MRYIEPHAHMVSRTTADYQAIAQVGCEALCEPAFWAGYDRASAQGFTITIDNSPNTSRPAPLNSASSIFAGSASTQRKPRTRSSHVR